MNCQCSRQKSPLAAGGILRSPTAQSANKVSAGPWLPGTDTHALALNNRKQRRVDTKARTLGNRGNRYRYYYRSEGGTSVTRAEGQSTAPEHLAREGLSRSYGRHLRVTAVDLLLRFIALSCLRRVSPFNVRYVTKRVGLAGVQRLAQATATTRGIYSESTCGPTQIPCQG